MVFIKDGDLYFQDGKNAPVRLAHVGEKSYSPKLSDDNQKVVFSKDNGNEYSINTDGTNEQIIIPNDWLSTFETGTNENIWGFVPGTHQLLIETYRCESPKFGSLCSRSVFLANADTGAIKKLADLGLIYQQNRISRNIAISPDGKMIAVGAMNGMKILTLDGKIIRQNILPYKPSTSTVLFPSLFWLPDSSGLIIGIPDTTIDSFAYGNYPAHTLWRYTIDNNVAIQIHLDAPPLPGNGGTNDFVISPDGNWGIYGGLGEADPSLYIVNLINGHKFGEGNDTQPSFSWGPDSKHFIYTSLSSTLGNVSQPANITPICRLDKWIDADHFTCWSHEKILVAKIGYNEVTIYDLGFDKNIDAFVLIKPK
jgi:Tol biopolymer transport system component